MQSDGAGPARGLIGRRDCEGMQAGSEWEEWEEWERCQAWERWEDGGRGRITACDD